MRLPNLAVELMGLVALRTEIIRHFDTSLQGLQDIG